MPRYIEAATGREISTTIALDASGRLRPGASVRNGPMQDGDHIAFDPFLMDSTGRRRENSVFLTDSKPCQFGAPSPVTMDRSAVDAQRRRWMTDKATAHRTDRQQPVARVVPHNRMVDHAPTPTAASGRTAIEDARRLWLADKANAHRRPQRG